MLIILVWKFDLDMALEQCLAVSVRDAQRYAYALKSNLASKEEHAVMCG